MSRAPILSTALLVAAGLVLFTGTASAHLAEARARLAKALQEPWSAKSFVSH